MAVDLPTPSMCFFMLMRYPMDDTVEVACRYESRDGRVFTSTTGKHGVMDLEFIQGFYRCSFMSRSELHDLALFNMHAAVRAHNAVVEPIPND